MSDPTLAALGISDEQRSTVPIEQAKLLSATLDARFDATGPLPLLWHWAFFNRVVPTADLGVDGHPRRDSPLLTDLPRRMWVGGSVRSDAPFRVDVPAIRRTRLAGLVRKEGSSGTLLIVTVEHTIEQGEVIVITERQDIVYRPASGRTAAVGPPVVQQPPADWHQTVHPTTALLFRFSAVTSNSHRIHYDHAYATEVESYPSLVVQGPLTAMMLTGSASHYLGAELHSFAYRATSPLFVDGPVHLAGVLHDDERGKGATMTATRSDGVVCMIGEATISPRRR